MTVDANEVASWVSNARAVTVLTGAGISAAPCEVAVSRGARLVVVNANPTPYDSIAAAVLRAPIGDVLPRLVNPAC